MVEQLDLFVCRQCDWNWFIHFIPPNPFRAVCDKSPVTVIALLQLFLSILSPANVGRGADYFPRAALQAFQPAVGLLSRFRTQNAAEHSGECKNQKPLRIEKSFMMENRTSRQDE
jgi:hypothetical protein